MGNSRQHSTPATDALFAVRPAPPAGIPRARDWLTPARNGYRFLAQIEALEEELDTIWPGWRHKQAVAGIPDAPLIRRTRWLLCRHAQLCAGRDWGVHLMPAERKPGGCIAQAIQPPDDPEMLEEYRGKKALFEGPPYSRPSPLATAATHTLRLATELGIHPAVVAEAMKHLPAGATPAVWVRHYATRRT